ncbi:putative SCAN domain-containing protein SCAND2P [Schistocerca piceifrons]|uniref:putative SCAN domain-containing protein SCAND2P n=1 Tax=Schistocerca piceifrons TaxID=274613 RepID=UPI001F5ECF7A|nr:putative SCAN domain-containing protein SCAND2P [Schistocerca piceifrons]
MVGKQPDSPRQPTRQRRPAPRRRRRHASPPRAVFLPRLRAPSRSLGADHRRPRQCLRCKQAGRSERARGDHFSGLAPPGERQAAATQGKQRAAVCAQTSPRPGRLMNRPASTLFLRRITPPRPPAGAGSALAGNRPRARPPKSALPHPNAAQPHRLTNNSGVLSRVDVISYNIWNAISF